MTRLWPLIPLTAACALVGCVERTNTQTYFMRDGADLVVSGSGPAAPVGVGQAAAFSIKVANSGNRDAAHVRIVDTPGVQSRLVHVTCNAEGGAACPAETGTTMTVPTIPVGGALHFTVSVQLTDAAPGVILNSTVATSDTDVDPNNNSVVLDAAVR